MSFVLINSNLSTISTLTVYLYIILYSFNLVLLTVTITKFSNTTKHFSRISNFLYLDFTSRFYFAIGSLSLLGVPPFSGFILKFFFIILILVKNNFFYFFMFFILTLLGIYFYMRLVKVTWKIKPTTSTLRSCLLTRKSFSFWESYFCSFICFFNTFFIFFYRDFFLILMF